MQGQEESNKTRILRVLLLDIFMLFFVSIFVIILSSAIYQSDTLYEKIKDLFLGSIGTSSLFLIPVFIVSFRRLFDKKFHLIFFVVGFGSLIYNLRNAELAAPPIFLIVIVLFFIFLAIEKIPNKIFNKIFIVPILIFLIVFFLNFKEISEIKNQGVTSIEISKKLYSMEDSKKLYNMEDGNQMVTYCNSIQIKASKVECFNEAFQLIAFDNSGGGGILLPGGIILEAKIKNKKLSEDNLKILCDYMANNNNRQTYIEGLCK